MYKSYELTFKGSVFIPNGTGCTSETAVITFQLNSHSLEEAIAKGWQYMVGLANTDIKAGGVGILTEETTHWAKRRFELMKVEQG